MYESVYPVNVKLYTYRETGRDLSCKKKRAERKKIPLGLKVIKAFLLALALYNI